MTPEQQNDLREVKMSKMVKKKELQNAENDKKMMCHSVWCPQYHTLL